MTLEPPAPDVMRRQLDALANDLRHLMDDVEEQLRAALPEGEWRRAGWVRLVGNGDSHAASLAATMAFHTLAGVGCEAVSALPFMAYGAARGVPAPEASRPLVVAISAGGATPLVLKAIDRARADGCRTVALTGAPGSAIARSADHAIAVPLPSPERSPGIRTFQASLAALLLMAIRIGQARGRCSSDDAVSLRREIRLLADAVEATRVANESGCDEVAARVADAPAQLVLGSGPSYGTARFAAAKLVEGAGVFAAAQDVEEWWHVERFAYPVEMPLFVIAPPGRSHSRAAEIAAAARGMGRQVIAVTATNDGQVAKHATIALSVQGACREEFSPLVYHLFASRVAAELGDRLSRSPFQADRPALRAAMEAYLASAAPTLRTDVGTLPLRDP